MKKEIANQLFQEIQESNFSELKTYNAEWIYSNLESICIQEKKEVTLENMMIYAGTLDCDLDYLFSSTDE